MDGSGDSGEGVFGSGPPYRPGRFRVDVRPDRGRETVVVAPLGELDHDTVEPLGTALEKHADAARIVVDCAGLDFCDSTGLNLLLKARARALEAGTRLDLAGLRPPVDRMFEITGALHVFQVYEDVRAALADDPWPDPSATDRPAEPPATNRPPGPTADPPPPGPSAGAGGGEGSGGGSGDAPAPGAGGGRPGDPV
ncbi:STAS domain-containing protein [Streptomyces roseolus]|uniref:STAS domain-containing protein n=1 Tax=Streptomyces roseolus TaxID=67358 RepID=UPI0037B0A3D2